LTTSRRAGRILAAAAVTVSAGLSAACGAASHSATPTVSSGANPPASAGRAAPVGPNDPPPPSPSPLMQDPVCGVELGQGYGLAAYEHFDAFKRGATPPPITDASVFVLRLTPDCDHGERVEISPPSAARITKRAPAADGLDAGVTVTSYEADYRIIGTGAVPFDQQVKATCVAMGAYCPSDPRYTGPRRQ